MSQGTWHCLTRGKATGVPGSQNNEAILGTSLHILCAIFFGYQHPRVPNILQGPQPNVSFQPWLTLKTQNPIQSPMAVGYIPIFVKHVTPICVHDAALIGGYKSPIYRNPHGVLYNVIQPPKGKPAPWGITIIIISRVNYSLIWKLWAF